MQVKSTIPIGYINYLRKRYIKSSALFIFSPEFLREGSAMYDVLNPERIVIGEKTKIGKEIAELFKKNTLKKNIPVLYTNTKEAESIKLFSNSYLALRVAFFNEIDNYFIIENLSTQEIIDGVCLDSRIGSHYNNPSFGYGGYCLPKDTKQLEHIFIDKPSSIIGSITKSNDIRTSFITKKIVELKPKIVGIYLLDSKKNADNFKSSSILEIIKKLQQNDIQMIIYDPNISFEIFKGVKVIKDFSDFCIQSEVIVTNRMGKELEVVRDKVFTRDIYQNN
ncbi:nucleotide sugar dehydrogenase [Enterococcus caccae]|uniref:nucleotide sugar dehydrogenase n=1 Tax=Enterococcus caccae TaxID=317735 RepID=UPI0031F6C812